MSSLRAIWTVALWEFHRYFKLKDQIIGFVTMVIGGVVAFSAVRIAETSSQVEIAVVGASAEFSLPSTGKIQQVREERSVEEWRQLVADRKVNGLLVLTPPTAASDPQAVWTAQLYVEKEPTWLKQLQPVLQNERIRWQMQRENVGTEQLTRIMTPAEVEVITSVDQGVSRADTVAAYCFLLGTLATSWMSLAWILTGITGEKNLRVTEQIVSAVNPQAWLDGKLLGITAASVGSLAFVVISGIIASIAAWAQGIEIPLPSAIGRPELLPAFLFFCVAGILFWNYFYAANAAIINDPHTSSRSAMMFLPLMPMFAASLVTSQPDGTMMKVLSICPGTSVTAMPMRLVLGNVSIIELIASGVLLIAAVMALREIAGRILTACILLTGREPSWLDILQCTVRRQREFTV